MTILPDLALGAGGRFVEVCLSAASLATVYAAGMTALDPRLIACADDVGYELRMIGVLGQLQTPTDLPFVGYGLLESLLVHVRLLDDFLANRRLRDDDLTASDYNSSWSSNGFLKTEERSAIHKKVVHLTRSRQDHKADQRWRTTGALDAEGNWHRSDLAKRALAASTKFIETLDPGTKNLFEPALTAGPRRSRDSSRLSNRHT